MERIVTRTLLSIILLFTACQEQDFLIRKEKLNKIEYTSLDKEQDLSRAIEQIGLNKKNSSSGRLMSGLAELKTDSILKVLQGDSVNYSYTISIDEPVAKKSFRNLIFKRVQKGFFAFVLEYVTDEPIINFQSFSGMVKRYDLEGILLEEVRLNNAKLSNLSGRVMACFADVTVECVSGGGTSTATGLPLPCLEWVTVITIDCSGGSGGGGGSSGGWSNPGTYVPDPYVGGGGGGGSSSGGSSGSTPPPTNDPPFEGGDPIGVLPPSSWPGSESGYP
ncbi:MAG: hypothetical protein O9302_04030 [Cyclobacteriaceae bacterium]|jgi:hypothetical protein|nr:hypothetical protein [Flammeovirgaceae bacterium]MCZ8021703.1 hypothetical protein [Cytophagales bacterium]MCZ8327207.1 hypothetical protein [Cyclobacteriaceae bacterium]